MPRKTKLDINRRVRMTQAREKRSNISKKIDRTIIPCTSLLKAGYTVEKKGDREFLRSPGGRLHLSNSKRLAESVLSNKVSGKICWAREKLGKWKKIGLSPPKSKKKPSKHASRTFVPTASAQQSVHITSIDIFSDFVENLSKSSKCSCTTDCDQECGGNYIVDRHIQKGVGGSLVAIIKCEKCGNEVDYGSKTKTNLAKNSSTKLVAQTRNNIGRSVMFGFLLAGRPMFSQYSKMFGFVGMDHFNSRTFQRAIVEVASTLVTQEAYEVCTHNHTHTSLISCTHTTMRTQIEIALAFLKMQPGDALSNCFFTVPCTVHLQWK